MVNSLSQIKPTLYAGLNTPMNGISVNQALDKVPVTSKINDKQSKSTLMVLGGGAALGPVLGMGIDKLMGPDGRLVKWSQAISDKTLGFDKKLADLKIGEKFSNLFKPITDKAAKPGSLHEFMKPLENSGLRGSSEKAIKTARASIKNAFQKTYSASLQKAAETATKNAVVEAAKQGLAGEAADLFIKNAVQTAETVAKKEARDIAIQVAKETAKKAVPTIQNGKKAIQTLDKLANMNKLGKLFGSTGIWLKKNLSGTTGVMNGLFAAMTVNSVIQAKKGEKFSTFMEDFLGTWVGSLGGYKLFEKGMARFARIDLAAKGVLPTIAKVINKIPCKNFIVPMAGAIALSTLLQKMSHVIFGKPTKETTKANEGDNLQGWLGKTGWTEKDFANVRAEQPVQEAAKAPVVEAPPYMPSSEVPPSVYNGETTKSAQDKALMLDLDKKVDATLSNLSDTLGMVGVKI